jgi:hypothetical protein
MSEPYENDPSSEKSSDRGEKPMFKYRLSVTDRRSAEEVRYNTAAFDPDGAIHIGKSIFLKETSMKEEEFDRHLVVRILRTLPVGSKEAIDDDEAQA